PPLKTLKLLLRPGFSQELPALPPWHPQVQTYQARSRQTGQRRHRLLAVRRCLETVGPPPRGSPQDLGSQPQRGGNLREEIRHTAEKRVGNQKNGRLVRSHLAQTCPGLSARQVHPIGRHSVASAARRADPAAWGAPAPHGKAALSAAKSSPARRI